MVATKTGGRRVLTKKLPEGAKVTGKARNFTKKKARRGGRGGGQTYIRGGSDSWRFARRAWGIRGQRGGGGTPTGQRRGRGAWGRGEVDRVLPGGGVRGGSKAL